MSITKQVKNINTHVFSITCQIGSTARNNRYMRCPSCGTKFIRLIATNHFCHIVCTICHWSEYYLRLNKNEERE